MTITIDTNRINSKGDLEDMNKLEEYAKNGIIEIVGTERLLQEMERYDRGKKKAESYKNISEPYTVGFSKIGSFYISGGEGIKFKEIAAILFPTKKPIELNKSESNDVMHLVSHSHSQSEYFVTNDEKDFINAKRTNDNRNGEYKNFKRNQLGKLGIKVVTSEEMLEIIETKLKKE